MLSRKTISFTALPPYGMTNYTANAPVLAKSSSPVDVIYDFRKMDLNKNGEITEAEFTDSLRSSGNPGLAQKFGLSDDFSSSNGTSAQYSAVFAAIDYDNTSTVNVSISQLFCGLCQPC